MLYNKQTLRSIIPMAPVHDPFANCRPFSRGVGSTISYLNFKRQKRLENCRNGFYFYER